MSSILGKLTNALTRAQDSESNGLFNFNVPGTSIGGVIPITKETQVTSIGELSNSLSDTMGNLATIAHMAYCIGEIIKDPTMLLGILSKITNNLTAVAFEMASRLASVISGQIMGLFSTVAGTALNLINSILDFLTALLQLFENLVNILKAIRDRGRQTWKNLMTQEDCEFMFANIACCLLNKLFGDKLAKFEQKVTNKITKFGQDLNTSLTNELADVNNLGNYIQHETFMMNKANAQLALLTSG